MRQLIDSWQALSDRRKDGICLVLLVIFCLLLFGKTVFFGQSISRVYELANLDYLFQGSLRIPSKYDVDCFYMKLPGYMLAATQWREGTLPLWNPYCGAGAPLLAELQSIVLSPWMLFYVMWPTLKMHSYLLVAQQVLATVGVYLAARALGLSRYAAIFAALVHLCCPHQQWRLELQMNHSFYPITLWSFIRLYQTRNYLWALAAGAGCAAQIVSGDAQVSLLSIAVASVFFVFMNVLGEARQEKFFNRLIDAGVWLAVAGINALCLSAPVFLGFVEYVRIGDLSKNYAYFSVGNPAPWESLVYQFVHPGFGGSSLYAGCLGLPLICLSLYALKKKRAYYASVLCTAVFAFMNASRTGFFPFFDQVAGLMGLSRFEGMEVYLVQLALLMAFGLEELLESTANRKNAFYWMVLAACIVTAAAPPILASIGLDLQKINFDSHIESYGFRQKQWLYDVIFLALFCALFFSRVKLKQNALLLLVVVPICMNTGSQILACKNALPHPPKFEYPHLELLSFLAETKERIIPVGFSLLHCNSNIVYKIPSLAFKGPLAPSRLDRFVRAAGAPAHRFRKVFVKGPFSKILDIASVRYILSLAPVRDSDEPYTGAQSVNGPVLFKGDDNVKVIAAKVMYDACKNEVGGYVDWFVRQGQGENYCFEIDVFDKTGNLYWTGGNFYVRQRDFFNKIDPRPKEFSRMPLDALLPLHVPESSEFSVGIKVYKLPNLQVMQPESRSAVLDKSVIYLASFTKKTLSLPSDRRFKLVSETPRSFIRIYESLKALPMASLVHNTIFAGDAKEALEEINKPTFNPRTHVVIEDRNLTFPGGNSSLIDTDEVHSTRPDANSLMIDVKAASPGLLVISDQYFPGWRAFVDGREAPVVRANHLFKAVPIGPGSHKVKLCYWPTYLTPGLILFASCLLLNSAAWLYLGRKKI